MAPKFFRYKHDKNYNSQQFTNEKYCVHIIILK